MWHLNFMIPLAVAFIGLVVSTVFLVNLLCEAIVDGTGKVSVIEQKAPPSAANPVL